MTKSTYKPSLLYKCKPFCLIGLQTNNSLILGPNIFPAIEEKVIKITKFITRK